MVLIAKYAELSFVSDKMTWTGRWYKLCLHVHVNHKKRKKQKGDKI